ncbi:MAG: ANTAR domain-containing protein [Burkholderiaceae bacterium]|jgi:AmiR/NasT family two-component response regulator|nr:ANTAR domain-containing protein [Burkholderiaceae bacterium]
MVIRDAIAELQTMTVGLYHPHDAEGKLIAQQLQRLALPCACHWPPTLEALRTANVAILSLVPETVSKFGPALIREFRKKVVVSVVSYESPTVLSLACEVSSSAMLYAPVRPFGVLSSLVLALNNHRHEEELHKRIQKLESRLEKVRLIEQAKRFLMETRGFAEDDAFRVLRQRAMEKRCSIEEVAANIVDARDALMMVLGDCEEMARESTEAPIVRRVK